MGGCMDTWTLARSATRDEVSFFAEHGWVRLPGLVGPGLVDILRLRAQARLTASGDVGAPTLTDQGRCRSWGEFAMAPGDATVHHALTVHGACENLGASPRLSFTVTYFDADALYTGAPYKQTDELSPRLRVNEPFDRPRFPLLPA